MNKSARGVISTALAGDRYTISFRRRFLALTTVLLAVNLAVGLIARQQQRAIIDHAVNIYDTAFISTNYVNLAQIAFQHYVDERMRAEDTVETSKANELLDDVLDNMDVAIERASSPLTRVGAQDIRVRLSELRDAPAGDIENHIAAIRKKMERLRQRNSDIGLKSRDDIEESSVKADLLLVASILTSITLAGLVLLVMHRMIGSMKRRSNDHFQAALEGMPQGLSLVDDKLRLIVCNARYAEMYDLPAELTKPGTSIRSIIEHRAKHGTASVDSEDFVSEKLAEAAQATTLALEQQLQDGRIISLIKAPLTTGGSITIHMDVTEKRNSERKIAFLAHHDALTALANRVQLREHIERTVKDVDRAGRAAILCLDLDNFKTVNDTLGHSVGDALLCAVAGRLQGLLGEGDLVSRTGGDEFAIVQTASEHAVEAAAALAPGIIEALSAPFEIGDHTVVIGASVGIAMAPDDGGDADQLLKNADMALYRAKGEGRGRFHFFEPEMDVKAQNRRLLELDLRKAIGAREFELFYQPIVNLADNRISGFEALLRWNHPTRGRVPPGEFIPVAEETGLITTIGEWVIRQACIDAKTWPSDLRVAVNVSPVQFRAKGLALIVTSAVANAGLIPDRLELEITETVLMHDNEETLATLRQLQVLGVRISMDDFGTGYSSLSYLRSFPFDKIKIDQSFVRDLINNPDSIGIIRAIAGLGQSMGVTTTAEGVETQEQLDQMRNEGCTEVQGFFYSRPVPVSEVASLLSGFGGRGHVAA
ncbi:bifunctional diguanylate cyclase/phosphodiesterase [Bradyrhizobium jicamae]|uniref:putative bifunctional diguanylate cyclase/phosphodiesterase n=1 Tax=Bradyrhizobium jicamae TaxID=280332 RepID=UPI001BAA9B04|nr:EAL domain-containing protein [Bradyrhizobium jicamae]MBR0933064.1 EAL domain-containing protein [Bradyrhizobium jicamae]